MLRLHAFHNCGLAYKDILQLMLEDCVNRKFILFLEQRRALMAKKLCKEFGRSQKGEENKFYC